MTSWHGLDNEAYDKINRQAIESRPVNGKIKDALSASRYVLEYQPLKKDFILEVPSNSGSTVLFPISGDPNSSALWYNIPAVARGPVEGIAPNYIGSYSEVAKHANRLNQLESQKTGGATHLFSVAIMPKEAA